jgi:hypothetical protein
MKLTEKDATALATIYESLDFKSSYGSDYDPQIEKLKQEATNLCYSIEYMLEGTIAYYKQNKEQYFNNPTHMDPLEALRNMEEHLRKPLYSYRGFRN